MTKKIIQYRFAVLLLWAATALVMNPILHAMGHTHADQATDILDNSSEVQWVAQELCPYCDAVSHCAVVSHSTPLVLHLERAGDIVPVEHRRAVLQPHLLTRLRAPPALA